MQVDLLLINPGNRTEQFNNLGELATVAQPLGVAMIAAFVRKHGFSVAIIDAEVEDLTPEDVIRRIKINYAPSIIGLTAFTTKMTSAENILKLLKRNFPYVLTVIGGHHPSAIPQYTLETTEVDLVVEGEGYYPILELLQWLRGKDVIPANIQGIWDHRTKYELSLTENHKPKSVDINELPFAAWDLLPMDKYRAHHWQAWDKKYNFDRSHFAIIYTSLGCPFNCDFCSVNVVYENRKIRYRSPQLVADELEHLVKEHHVRHVEIIDDTFTLNFPHAQEVCKEIIKRKINNVINIWCFARASTLTIDLANLMKEAGINWVFMGFEAGNDQVLKGVRKNQSLYEIRRGREIANKAGLYVGGNYVFGLPNDTFETMQQTLDLALELNTEFAQFYLLMPYPGTKLYERAKQLNYPLPGTWGEYGFFNKRAVPMRNEILSHTDILKFRDQAFITYFSGERYQNMILNRFGQEVVDYINNTILSKKLVREYEENTIS